MSTNYSQKWRNRLVNLSLPTLSLLAGIFSGLVAWLLLDPIQGKHLEQLFQNELVNRLDMRAVETRRRFEEFIKEWQLQGHAISNHWQLITYLNSFSWYESAQRTKYYNESPNWLEIGHPNVSLIAPGQVVLMDMRGKAREIYQRKLLPFNIDRILDLYPKRDDAVITLIEGTPYLLVWSNIAYQQDTDPAVVLLIIDVDELFLAESQKMAHGTDTLIALIDSNDQRLLVSSNQEKIPQGSYIRDWRDSYLLTSQAITQYQSLDHDLLFTTMVSRDVVQQNIKNISKLAQLDRLLAALVYVVVFSFIIFLISAKINQVLKRISRYGQQALGVQQPVIEKGNVLLQLEDWVKKFFRQLITARDTLHDRQEKRIRETEVLKSALFDNSMVSIVTLDEQGIVVEVNGTALNTFGYSRRLLMGRRLEEIAIKPDDRSRFRDMLGRCIKRSVGPSLCRDQPMLAETANGEEKAIECSVIPIHLQNQTLFNVYLRDVSGRRQAEREIASLAKLASENPNPVLRINDKGVIVYANDASEPLLTYWDCERGQTLPLYWRNLVASVLKEGVNKVYEINLEDQIYSLQLASIRELDYVNIYGRDFTQMRLAEMQSRQHQSELVHVCRLSTMGEMSTGLAHELNQPLSAIINFASGCVRRLQTGSGGEAELLDAMAQITVQAERAGEIIKRLRSLVGKRPQEREAANLNHLVLEVASFIEFEADREKVEVCVELSDEVLPVMVDLVQIEQVLLNLVRNAIDAMKQVDVSQRRLLLKTERVNNKMVQVLVRDSGPGMSPETLEHLFDAFFSTKKGGMGMGLRISQKIMQDHHGLIEVVSEVDEGTTFHVILPTDPKLELPGF
ncbi:MAG: ATP-binding protein [Candidatus Thiodiazotropha taylori]|nr:ATP-binding protein [Candidatus Thiodiazotropha taylori]MCW4224452.1 ATP-binding protein [Candidatus Thiodiazotropha endolucinida]MCG7883218.1 ATP-binding protein [Candidatus Thiodiazotropha taylori]MCG7886026.1 ATP-binding protein [Candidatus Thiodiazotropha taylori]MCG7891411.1 ATP-binding protein [Candidatus Thiodiazotropha taylori]